MMKAIQCCMRDACVSVKLKINFGRVLIVTDKSKSKRWSFTSSPGSDSSVRQPCGLFQLRFFPATSFSCFPDVPRPDD